MKSIINRLGRWIVDFSGGYLGKPQPVLPLERYNLVGSEVSPGRHVVAIDIDKPVELHPSTTEGHFHLLIDHEMSWDSYRALLLALAAAGIVEEGYAYASVKHGRSYLRPPGVRKGTNDTLINIELKGVAA